MRTRPHISRIRTYTYKSKDGSGTEGIGLFKGRELAVHLTPSEAIELANTLVDEAEKFASKERTSA